jgi:hypothetical protein
MNLSKKGTVFSALSGTPWGDAPGIVIADGGAGRLIELKGPRVRAFVYGEEQPTSPTLPFGRWKA